ncbi:hypothetical protein Taro_037937, partial [Colocasia esculenta]|nr:hypothetical protein [Colocasia esculenta]
MELPCQPPMPPAVMAARKRILHLPPLPLLCLLILFLRQEDAARGLEILSKSRLEKCVKASDSDKLECNKKIVVNVAVPSGSSGGEASIVAELVEVEGNDTNKMQTIRAPPVVTINKSAAYALYELMYIRDVPYKPEEFYVKTRKCEPDASAKVVQTCERQFRFFHFTLVRLFC